MGKHVTVVFEPSTEPPVFYTVYGVGSGGQIALASGWASGTVSVSVSGYDNYALSASVSTLVVSQPLKTNATVTVVFGTQQDFYTILWSIFEHIGKNWGNADQCDMPESQFQQVIDWQVALDPKYVVHYAAAVAEYTRILQLTGSVETALSTLFSENTMPDPKLPAVQTYVLGEFMEWQVAFGGFRAFGPPYVNYSGWMGGGTFDQSPPPYRALNDE